MTQWSYIWNWMYIVTVCKAVTAPLFMAPTALISMSRSCLQVWGLIFSNPCQAKEQLLQKFNKRHQMLFSVWCLAMRGPLVLWQPLVKKHQDAEVWLHRKGTHTPRTLKLQNHSCKNNQKIQQYDKYKKWLLMRKWSKTRKIPKLILKNVSMSAHGK